MKYKNFLLIFIISVFVTNCFSQVKECGFNSAESKTPIYEPTLLGKAFYNKFPNKEEQFFNNWSNGDIYFTNNTSAKNKLIRYNALLDEILWMRERDFQIIILNRENIASIHFHADKENSQSHFIKIDHKNIQHPNNKNMFVQLLSDADDNVILLKK